MSLTHPLPDPPPPREIAPGVWWIGGCLQEEANGEPIHNNVAAFLIVGSEASLMVDTGFPSHWEAVSDHLDQLLAGRPLDLLVPTHSELPHAGNLGRLFQKYPDSRLLGDVADYHLFHPEFVDRFEEWPREKPLSLGTDHEVTLLQAPIRDLSRTQWVYESKHQVLFVGDGFAYTHPANEGPLGEPGHAPGQCRLLSSELPAAPTPTDAAFVTQHALVWAKLVDAKSIRADVSRLMTRYPARVVAPAHGNVIDNPSDLEQVLFDAFQMIFDEYATPT